MQHAYYIVKKGDKLSEIAKKNNIKNANLIYAGQKLLIR